MFRPLGCVLFRIKRSNKLPGNNFAGSATLEIPFYFHHLSHILLCLRWNVALQIYMSLAFFVLWFDSPRGRHQHSKCQLRTSCLPVLRNYVVLYNSIHLTTLVPSSACSWYPFRASPFSCVWKQTPSRLPVCVHLTRDAWFRLHIWPVSLYTCRSEDPPALICFFAR